MEPTKKKKEQNCVSILSKAKEERHVYNLLEREGSEKTFGEKNYLFSRPVVIDESASARR